MKAIRYTLKDYALSRQSGGNYKLRSKRCWHKFNDSTAIHCPSECCYADYNVTLYGNQVMLNSSDPNDPGGSCSPCSYICDDQDLEGGWLPKISDYGLGIAESNNNFVYIQPNPASGKLDLIFLSVNTGKFILRVFDCIGNEVHKESINKELTEYKVEINVSNYSSGMYYYQFSQNGFIAIRGKFIIKH
jgi:hypothetical protein